MSGEKDLDQLKKEAAAKAKAEALKKRKEKEGNKTSSDDLAKQKAAAAAKAKAAALAKKRAQDQASSEGSSDSDAKAKAAAAAKVKAAAVAKAKAAAAAKAKVKASKGKTQAEQEKEEAPSPNQPVLDKYMKVIEQHLGQDVIEESYVNRLSKDVPTLVVKKEAYFNVAKFLKHNEQLGFDYLSELHGTDFETYMEVYVYLYSFRNNQSIAIKVKLDRDQPEIDSVVSLWAGADWPECEAYDLLGIQFINHPNLHRIMLGEKWVGYPLRKDYEDHNELEV